MTAKKEYPKRETTPFIQDEIQKERIRRELAMQVEYTEFRPSLEALYEPTPDKPGIDSFCSRQYFKPAGAQELDAEDEELLRTISLAAHDLDPRNRYKEPPTTTLEIGWDQTDYKPFESMFNHKHKKTDISNLPSRNDPFAIAMGRK